MYTLVRSTGKWVAPDTISSDAIRATEYDFDSFTRLCNEAKRHEGQLKAAGYRPYRLLPVGYIQPQHRLTRFCARKMFVHDKKPPVCLYVVVAKGEKNEQS